MSSEPAIPNEADGSEHITTENQDNELLHNHSIRRQDTESLLEGRSSIRVSGSQEDGNARDSLHSVGRSSTFEMVPISAATVVERRGTSGD